MNLLRPHVQGEVVEEQARAPADTSGTDRVSIDPNNLSTRAFI